MHDVSRSSSLKLGGRGTAFSKALLALGQKILSPGRQQG